jgi:hypothetical protein
MATANTVRRSGSPPHIAQAAAEGFPSEGVSGPSRPHPTNTAENDAKPSATATDLAFGPMSERWKNSIVLLGGGFGHQAFAFLLVAGEGSFDDGEGGIGGTDVFDLDALAFELFVVREETLEDEKPMLG